MSLVTILKGLSHVGIHLSGAEAYMLAGAIAVVVGLVGKVAISRLKMSDKTDRQTQFKNVEKSVCDPDGTDSLLYGFRPWFKRRCQRDWSL